MRKVCDLHSYNFTAPYLFSLLGSFLFLYNFKGEVPALSYFTGAYKHFAFTEHSIVWHVNTNSRYM